MFSRGSLHRGSQPTGPDERPKGIRNVGPQSLAGLEPSLCTLGPRGNAMEAL